MASVMRADCRGPGSAPEPYARFEYGTTFTFIGVRTVFECYTYMAPAANTAMFPVSSFLWKRIDTDCHATEVGGHR